jgi:AcrR family transcriptional regulator
MPKIVDHDEVRARIAEVTSQSIASIGLDKSTLRTVALQAGCTTGMLAHYFPNKIALLVAALKSVASLQLSKLEAQAVLTPDDLPAILSPALPIDEESVIALKVWMAMWSSSSTNLKLDSVRQSIHRDYLLFYIKALELTGAVTCESEIEENAERIIGVVNGVSVQALQSAEEWPREQQIGELRYLLSRIFPNSVNESEPVGSDDKPGRAVSVKAVQ